MHDGVCYPLVRDPWLFAAIVCEFTKYVVLPPCTFVSHILRQRKGALLASQTSEALLQFFVPKARKKHLRSEEFGSTCISPRIQCEQTDKAVNSQWASVGPSWL